MARDFPYRRTEDGKGYACGNCGADLPDGAQVLGHWKAGGKLDGVTAQSPDGALLHSCGPAVRGDGGQHG